MRAPLLALLLVFVPRIAFADDEAPTEVTIAGTRVAKTPGSAHVVTEKRLDTFKYDDPTQVLQQVPGVYSRGEDGFGLRPNIGLRGVNPDRSKKITLLEDGIPFGPAPYSAPAAYYFPLMPRMTAVRVIKGPGALSYGPQTVGGVIDYVTRAVPFGTAGAVDLATGQYGYAKAHGWAGWGNEKQGVLLEAVHMQNSGFKELPSGADTGFSRNEWMAKAFYVLDPEAKVRHEFRIKGTYADEVSNETYLGLSDADFRKNPLQRYAASALDRMKWFRTGVSLTHVMTVSPSFSLTTTAYRNDFSRTWRKVNHFRGADIFDVLTNADTPRNAVYNAVLRGQDSGSSDETLYIGPNQRVFVSQGVDSRIRWDVATGPITHKVEYGAHVQQDWIDRLHTEDAFLTSSGQLVAEKSPTVTTAFNRAKTEALALHAIDAISWKNLTLTPGVHVEAYRTTFRDYMTGTVKRALKQAFLPGAGAFYSIVPSFGLLAGAYRGFSPATPEGAESGAEQSVNYEAGARFVRKQTRIEAIGFYNDYSNLTDYCTESSGCSATGLDRTVSAGAARIWGLEAFASTTVPVSSELGFPVTASYTATQSEFLSTFQSDDPIYGNVRSGDEIPYVPRHTLNASIGVETRPVSAAVAMNFVSKMREVAGSVPLSETIATDDILTFDASVTYRIFRWLSIYGNVRNIFDDHSIVSRRPFGARPNAPRWAQIGVKATFD